MTPVELTVVVPTRNERDSVRELVARVSEALESRVAFDILFVDDSDDDTPVVVEAVMDAGAPVRLLHRTGSQRKGGLSGAVLAGFAASPRSRLFAVIDGDLQHPPEVLTAMLDAMNGGADLVIASRFIDGGGAMAGLDGPMRRVVSHASRAAARLAVVGARSVQDPLSGCFMLRSRVVVGAPLEATGFKLLLEILQRGFWDRVCEVPMQMGERTAGASNAGVKQGLQYAAQLAKLSRSA